MTENEYNIRYLPSFSKELNEVVYYIAHILKNKKAAHNLINNVIKAITERSKNPESYEIYKSKRKMKYNWYRIYVGNFIVFYTVENRTMTIAHLIYSKRDINKIV